MSKTSVRRSACQQWSAFQQWSDPEYRSRMVPTLYLLVAYAAMGFIASQRGAAFLDIQLITHTTLETASYFFTASAVGAVVGGVLFGGLYDKLNKSLVLYIVVLGVALSVSAIPYCTIYGFMAFFWFLGNFFYGGYDACASADVVRRWGLKSQRYLFLVNVGYSVGAFLAPIVTEPFLVPKDVTDKYIDALHKPLCSNLTENVSVVGNASGDSVHYSELNPIDRNSSQFDIPLCLNSTIMPEIDIQLHYAYFISAIFAFVTSLPLLYQVYSSRKTTLVKPKESEYGDVRELPVRHFAITIVIIIVTYICISGIEDAISSFLMTFVVKQLNWTKSMGAQLSSLFFGLYGVCRFVGIFCKDAIGPSLILFSSMFIIILLMSGIIVCSIHFVDIGVWILVPLCGFVVGTLFPVGIAWINKTLVSVTGKVSSVLLIGSASGKLLNPIILGYCMEEYSPLYFCYIIIIEAAVCTVTVLLSTLYGHKILSSFRRQTTELAVAADEKSID